MTTDQDFFDFDLWILLKDVKLICNAMDRDKTLTINKAYRKDLWEAMAALNHRLSHEAFNEYTGKGK